MTQQAHTHPHPHPHPTEENPDAGQGAVVLDIGGDVGALVVAMPASTVGDEVEILPAGAVGRDEPAHRPHVAVVDRALADGGRLPSLVYPSLHEGRYDLLPKGTDEVSMTVAVRGGEVTQARWPSAD